MNNRGKNRRFHKRRANASSSNNDRKLDASMTREAKSIEGDDWMTWSVLTKDLNADQMAFCEEYIGSRNAKHSYMKAYPKAKESSASSSGHRLLQLPKIYNYINALINEYGPNIRMSDKELIAEVEKMAMNPNVESSAKLAAIKMIGQARGMFADKMEITTKEFNITVLEDDQED